MAEQRAAPDDSYGQRVIEIAVPSRTHVELDAALTGAAAWVFLEELTWDACLFAGIDPSLPMRRDIVRVIRARVPEHL